MKAMLFTAKKLPDFGLPPVLLPVWDPGVFENHRGGYEANLTERPNVEL